MTVQGNVEPDDDGTDNVQESGAPSPKTTIGPRRMVGTEEGESRRV